MKTKNHKPSGNAATPTAQIVNFHEIYRRNLDGQVNAAHSWMRYITHEIQQMNFGNRNLAALAASLKAHPSVRNGEAIAWPLGKIEKEVQAAAKEIAGEKLVTWNEGLKHKQNLQTQAEAEAMFRQGLDWSAGEIIDAWAERLANLEYFVVEDIIVELENGENL